MPTPTQRHNHARIGRANAHQHLDKKSLIACSQCKKPVMPHQVCAFCGTYKGRQMKAAAKRSK
ncbi:MAG: 50S ribosomal protein L32 [Patescibacteria group bacterium]